MSSITLLDVVQGANRAQSIPVNHHATLIYGPPKSGKTTLAATVARSKNIDRVFWFDCENGLDTVKSMILAGELTESEAAKIVPISIKDTKAEPEALSTMLKSVCTRNPVNICQVDGLIDSVEGKKNGWPFITFHYAGLTSRDCIVLDSLSQIGNSALALVTKGQATDYKLRLDDYGATGKWLADLLGTIQAAKYCYWVCVTQEVDISAEDRPPRIVPLCGTKNFSEGIGKNFGTMIYMNMKAKKHVAISTTESSSAAQAGSRLRIKMDGQKELCLGTALDESGVFTSSNKPSPVADSETTEQEAVATEVVEKPMSALDRLKAKQK